MKSRIKTLKDENRELETKQEKMQEDISKSSSQLKKLQEQISSLKKKRNHLAEQQETTTSQIKGLRQSQPKECHNADGAVSGSVESPEEQKSNLDQVNPIIASIPLRNTFEVLQDESEGNS